jgi:hypothetical protein
MKEKFVSLMKDLRARKKEQTLAVDEEPNIVEQLYEYWCQLTKEEQKEMQDLFHSDERNP